MKTIIAGINLLLAAGFGALNIWKLAKGDKTVAVKVDKVRSELNKIVDKMEKLAITTTLEWDDTLADILDTAIEAIANTVIEQLEVQA